MRKINTLNYSLQHQGKSMSDGNATEIMKSITDVHYSLRTKKRQSKLSTCRMNIPNLTIMQIHAAFFFHLIGFVPK